jgi:hypothetical protein
VWAPAILGMLGLAACASAGSSADPGKPDARLPADANGGQDAPIDALANVCPSTDTCTAATMLGTVSGDTGNQKLTASGYRSAWYRVRVTEDDSSVVGVSLRVGANLTSPSGLHFDTFVYLNSGTDAVECATTVGSVSTAGNVETIHAEWGEGTIANGSDDGRYVSIEVRPPASGCTPAQAWQLEIEGDWN